MERVRRLLEGQQGQGLAEYGMLGGFITVVAVAALTLAGGIVASFINSLATSF